MPDLSGGHAQAAVLSVSSLNRMARSLLEANFPAVLVEGEISNLARPASGHWYLTLKDKNSQLRCAMFRGNNRLLRFQPENGQQVLVRGRLSIYEGRGDYQLIAESMEEAGDGALRRAFEQLKAKLTAEGLFEVERKQPVGDQFRHIGLVTSATGAAIKDLLSVFARRFPAIQLTLFPVAVQGREALPEIVRAIELANRLRDSLGLEALIVGRGGGSLEDLQAFNEEAVARAIAASELPVTSAVGHEIDFTIADFVADLRAPTPSAAAEMMSPAQDDYLQQLQATQRVLTRHLQHRLQHSRQALHHLQQRLQRPDRRLQEHAQTLDRLEQQLRRAMRQNLHRHNSTLQQLQRALRARSPQLSLQRLQQQLLEQRRRLAQGGQAALRKRQASLDELSRGLHAVSPLATLSRGYSITFDDSGNLVSKADSLTPGGQIHSRLAWGEVVSTVTAVLPGAEDQE